MHYIPRLLTAGPAFFLSAWFLMLFGGVFWRDVGIRPFGYVTAMVVTIALWLVVAPAAGAVSGAKNKAATNEVHVHGA